jgi:hypothetical protein
MNADPKVVIVGGNPLFVEPIRRLLETASFRCHVFTPAEIKDHSNGFSPDVALVIPLTCREMKRLPEVMEAGFPGCAYAVAGDPRLPGMWVSDLPPDTSTIVSSTAAVEELPGVLRALCEGTAASPECALLDCFTAGVRAAGKPKPRHWPSAREMQFGCAVSLGFRVGLLARELHVCVGTAKCHLQSLTTKLKLASSRDVSRYFEEVLLDLIPSKQGGVVGA